MAAFFRRHFIEKYTGAGIFFLALLCTGITIYPDFGISWDEPMQRDLGNYCVDFVRGDNFGLYSMQNRFHGGNYETIVALPEKLLGLTEGHDIYRARHLLIFISFFLSAFCFYLVALHIFKHKLWALIPVICFVFTPRIFAHGFYNSKDIPFMAAFLFATWCMLRFWEKPGYFRAALLALATGLAISNRILGVLIPAFTTGWFLLDWILKKHTLKDLRFLAVYFLLAPLFTIACWPVLWTEPLYNIQESVRMMSKFPYTDPALFRGMSIIPGELPWYYVPYWIFISVPIVYQVLFAGGLIGWILSFRKWFSQNKTITHLVAWLFLPWLMVVVLHSVIYDEWRHLFFTYPAFLMIGIWGLRQLTTKLGNFKWKALVYIPLVYQWVAAGVFMVRWHPYEGLYFNAFAPQPIHEKMDLDYWGLSYQEAWKYLVEKYPGRDIKVMWQNPSGEYNLLMIPSEQRKHLIPTFYYDAEFFVTDYRFHPEPPYDGGKEYSVIVDGMEICTIYRNPYFKGNP